ncbi:hypothetical protein [Pedobacter soli]|uniref:Auto-transporter adhesin head GIN domain-containing protein n=1 Tax=Pedobacter soli TaxID=390242 RepID=A0A1G7ATV2_9SPHI|nr:hypothetical protein [Pedobacter soli]SDE18233.1 hypothetical protein SAMN04488024_11351 [Pedobacter soli]
MMMIKKSNLVLVAFAAFFVASLFAADRELAIQYHRIDLKDPFKNFGMVPVRPYKVLNISGGNSYTIRIERGTDYTIRLMNSRKQFFRMEQHQDTLSINFTVSNQHYQLPEQCTTGLILTVAALAMIKTSGVNCELSGLEQGSLLVKQEYKAILRMNDLRISNLVIGGKDSSTATFRGGNRTDTLCITLDQGSSVDLGTLKARNILAELKGNARLVITAANLNNLVK